MLTKKRIDNIKEDIYEGQDVTDGVAARHAVNDDTVDDLRPETSKEFVEYKKLLGLLLLADAIQNKDRKELLALTDWSLVSYDGTRAMERAGMVSSAQETWTNRTYLANATQFSFNQNSKKIDAALTKTINDRINSFNKQERKRITVIMNEGKKRAWSSSKIAEEIKFGAGLNSIQQKTLYNLQKGMLEEGLTKGAIIAKSESYRQKALNYRADLTARWEASTVVNEGQLQLWEQLVDEEIIEPESKKRWVTILDAVTGTSDRAMNGQEVPLSTKFVDPTLKYAPLMRPPLRGNCRCDMELIPLEVV